MENYNLWPHWKAELFDITKIPFSRSKSFLAISALENDELWLRSVRGGDEHTDGGKLFRLVMLNADGVAAPFKATLQPDCLCLQHSDGILQFSFADGDTICIKGKNAGLQISMQPKSYDYVQTLEKVLHISHARQDLSARLSTVQGSVKVDAPWQGMRAERIQLDLLPDDGVLSASMHLYRIEPFRLDNPDFEQAQQATRNDFATWLAATLPVDKEMESGRLLAAYLTWSCLVPAGGKLSQAAMYMSKNWMTNIWSWDHCFNALAQAKLQPEIAWQQMKVIFDEQHSSGRLPDFINDDFSYWRFTKPPVHGWTFAQLRQAAPEFYTSERCEQVIRWLSLQTASWMNKAIDGLPRYDHGNDAGWDNSTIFIDGTPLSGPDLATFLILQMREIADLHLHLGHKEDSLLWQNKAKTLQDILFEKLWSGKRFFAINAITKKMVSEGDSLIRFIPFLLGHDLPDKILEVMLADLQHEGRFITAYGAATEATNSKWYQADGYWRGPIWAPAMALLCDGLRACHETILARELAQRFIHTANQAGMAENFDALSGEGLRDPAFTWTSSVFLLLANRYRART